GVAADYDVWDHTIGPRPLRGIIQLSNSLLNVDANALEGMLGGGVAHEVGHYWLVPGAARIHSEGGEVQTPTTQDIWTALNQGHPVPAYPIMARQDAHWSPFIHAQDSPMDGVNHISAATEAGWAVVNIAGPSAGINFTVPGVGPITVRHRYSPLELWM